MLGSLPSRGLPVKNHLQSEDGVESKASDEAVEDDFVRNFLQGREDAREGAEEVGEDLCRKRTLAMPLALQLLTKGCDLR